MFSPAGERPFAGPQTLGGAHARLAAGLFTPFNGILDQERALGLVRISVESEKNGRRATLALPAARMGALTSGDEPELEAALVRPVDPSDAPAVVDVGPVWMMTNAQAPHRFLATRPISSGSPL